ncbi:hypothetical protein [Lactococcus lactis]|uniref:hypothetical protein n=3 Tax=Bacillati TaxID=1783272 RepID=UPI00071D25F6|nr:hypothetical protein [Lactococcus lactis]KST97857.1 hypothetical protein KF146_0376 [Lactococcus lactis subsp. lactis]MDU0397642.1 hypothetical protein [Lactococcus lactis]
MHINYILLAEATSKRVSDTNSNWFGPSSILSIIAIIISIGTLFFQNYKNEKHHRTNLEAGYFKDIYLEYLLKEIPRSRQKVIFNGEKITGTDDIIEVLNLIRQDSLFFKYKSPEYYRKIVHKIQELEDKYIDPKVSDSDSFAEFHAEVEKLLSDIYRIIFDEYLGKRRFSKFKRKNKSTK